ncbi:MAG: hypothetical protein RLZZ182_1199 [Pseudomonadota bacterium]
MPLLCLGLVACAQVSVRRVNTVEPASYELRASHMQALEREAEQRCPKGFEVTRRAELKEGLEPDWRGARWWNLGLLRLDDEGNRAQLAVTCR